MQSKFMFPLFPVKKFPDYFLAIFPDFLRPQNTNLMYLSLQIKLSNQAKSPWK